MHSNDKIGYGIVSENILVLVEGDFALIPFSFGTFDINDQEETFTLPITFYRLTGVGSYDPVPHKYYLKSPEDFEKFETIAFGLYRQLLEEQSQAWKSRGLLSRIWGNLKNLFVK